MKNALISVSDKTNLIELANFLIKNDYEIISTGGTYSYLLENGIRAVEVSDLTGFEEILDGRVKTLHPLIHAGILYKRDDLNHVRTIEKMKCRGIDLVIVNLYPFFENVKSDISFDEKIEFIDIGGPSLIRGASKNFKFSTPVIDPMDYEILMDSMVKTGDIPYETRKYLAGKAFSYTSVYDSAIAAFLNDEDFPEYISGSYKKEYDLRYGENPHQSAAFYKDLNSEGTFSNIDILQGKSLSYNNIRDIDIAQNVVSEFDSPCCCAVKHNTPCGVALGENVLEAYKGAYECDNVSIFGGIVAFNKEVDLNLSKKLCETFLEVIIAPSYSNEALETFSKKPNLRIVRIDKNTINEMERLSVSGGMLLQTANNKVFDKVDVVTKLSPNKEDIDDIIFGMKVVKYVKSNAIIIVKNKKTLGISGGEVSRIAAAKNALERSENGGVLISDAFFPFDDVVTLSSEYNVTSIAQPGGSIKDKISIDKCNELNIPMVFTGIRHFKH